MWNKYKNQMRILAYLLLLFDIYMGASLQDYSWIQDFEADFP